MLLVTGCIDTNKGTEMSGVIKVNQYAYSFIFIVLIISLFSPSAFASSSWQGKWDSSRKPVENPVVYYYYELTDSSEGFSWKSVSRDVPYGPNQQVSSGKADFVSESQAVDYNNKLIFDIRRGDSGERVLTVSSQEQDSIVENFYFVPVFHKAGFDCNKASTSIEKAICTDRRIAMADLEINQQYKKARKLLADVERRSLITSQRSWIKQRNRCRVGGKADINCLALSYAHRLATLQKINNPVLGGGEGINPNYLFGLQKSNTAINSNVPFLLLVASERLEWAVEIMKHPVSYNVNQVDDKTILSARYAYKSVCWPADCIINVVMDISIDRAGNIKVVKNKQSKNL